MALTLSLNLPQDFNGSYVVPEGGIIQIRVVSSDPALSESVQIAPSSFYAGSFVSTVPQTVNFTAGGAAEQFVQFQLTDDQIFELDDYFELSMTPLNNATLNTWYLYGRIQDNDNLPSVSITARENTIVEGAADAVFRFDIMRQGVDLSMTTDVEVRFEGVAPTPASSADFSGPYAALTPALVRFAPGETVKTIELPIVDDNAIEGSEVLRAFISNSTSTSESQSWPTPQYTPITNYDATVAILNDDPNVSPPPPSTTVDTFRFYNAGAGTHFYTTSVAERDNVIANVPGLTYEGVGFQSVPGTAEGADAVYRFYNTATGTHFFTISAAERDSVIANIPSYTYEGIGLYASNQNNAGLTEMYRFYNTNSGTHFYTAGLSERDVVIANIPSYRYEGAGFYVPETRDADYLLG
ncbi:Calx-beta domain-containing protein [Teichococcus oryzae]|uniref:Calx-beta domain-containing protein n=1 Tax=Teichococcus oryzae TaxID=1608942 RepID=A0A5B2TIR7_9PROT|nr:Calx-beta domain-containing protein [Pseudoroseomonas oryzae]KAA2213984.1 hypothetical protein F0Q34_08050 [Pseudoroseomonas oryzae]